MKTQPVCLCCRVTGTVVEWIFTKRLHLHQWQYVQLYQSHVLRVQWPYGLPILLDWQYLLVQSRSHPENHWPHALSTYERYQHWEVTRELRNLSFILAGLPSLAQDGTITSWHRFLWVRLDCTCLTVVLVAIFDACRLIGCKDMQRRTFCGNTMKSKNKTFVYLLTRWKCETNIRDSFWTYSFQAFLKLIKSLILM